ncbi:hypothetical protein HAX54_014868, partial [Datura stramonium]|nr:hypothetical protein [Datura stramonium]
RFSNLQIFASMEEMRVRAGCTTQSTTHCKVTSIGNKKQQKAVTWKEIAKRRQLRDESKSDNSSGSGVHYNIETSDESPVVTTRAKSKGQEAVVATASAP